MTYTLKPLFFTCLVALSAAAVSASARAAAVPAAAGKTLYAAVVKQSVRKKGGIRGLHGKRAEEYFFSEHKGTQVSVPTSKGFECVISIANNREGFTRVLWEDGITVPYRVYDSDCRGTTASVKAYELGGAEIPLSQANLDAIFKLIQIEIGKPK